MKKNIHPTYYHDAVVTCACGNTFVTGSTKKDIRVETCAACHPFFTGQQKFLDIQGRVEKFQAKQKAGSTYVRKQRQTKEQDEAPKTLKDMLKEAKKIAGK